MSLACSENEGAVAPEDEGAVASENEGAISPAFAFAPAPDGLPTEEVPCDDDDCDHRPFDCDRPFCCNVCDPQLVRRVKRTRRHLWLVRKRKPHPTGIKMPPVEMNSNAGFTK